MIISRRRYESELNRSYNEGYDKAMERFNQNAEFERIWKKIHELEKEIHRPNKPCEGFANEESHTCKRHC